MKETNIKKSLCYWLLLPLLCFSLEFAGLSYTALHYAVKVPAITSANPQVLGATTEPRGVDTHSQLQFDQTKLNLVSIAAESYIVFDSESGTTILEKNGTESLSIASITKLMTGLVALKNLSFNDVATITPAFRLRVSPSLNFATGERIKIANLFEAMIVGSENDAALALAGITEKQTGMDFVELMNAQAKILGMSDTSFSNPIGFDSRGNFSTAEDLKKLITETQKYPEFKVLGSQEFFSFVNSEGKRYQVKATNKLLKNHPELQAIKTGFTPEAQGAMATKLTIGTKEIIILVLDSADREGDTLLLDSQLTFSALN